ncbi:MAG: hypothetical protein RM338_03660 [Nostoc sp. DedQUE12a]|nr:hypothetical protein [Nostoc sp. DedQUE12a]
MLDIDKQLRKLKEPPKVLQWQNQNGESRLTIRLEDEDAGVEFERQFKESGKVSVSLFLRELLRPGSSIYENSIKLNPCSKSRQLSTLRPTVYRDIAYCLMPERSLIVDL